VRGGYSYDQSPQPATSYSPFLHELARHAISLGGSWKYGKVSIDVAARYVARRSLSTLGVNRYDYDGSYQTSGVQAGVGFGFRF
jgi:long-subunit fatty acid transport protein